MSDNIKKSAPHDPFLVSHPYPKWSRFGVLREYYNRLSSPGSTPSAREQMPGRGREGQVKKHWAQRGFTIVELLVTISLIGIITVSLMGIFANYLVIITRNNTFVDMTVDSQNLLRATVEELRYGAGVRQTNSLADPNAPSGGWNTSNSNFVIIIAVPAIDAAGNYIINSDTGAPYNNELVYFKNGTTLYKRTLANAAAIGNRLVTSCPANLVSSTCPGDRMLTHNVDTFTFTLYNQDNAITTDSLLARSVKIDLSLKRETYGEPLVFDNSIRITLRNNFS